MRGASTTSAARRTTTMAMRMQKCEATRLRTATMTQKRFVRVAVRCQLSATAASKLLDADSVARAPASLPTMPGCERVANAAHARGPRRRGAQRQRKRQG